MDKTEEKKETHVVKKACRKEALLEALVDQAMDSNQKLDQINERQQRESKTALRIGLATLLLGWLAVQLELIDKATLKLMLNDLFSLLFTVGM